jgi:hypothetical protein
MLPLDGTTVRAMTLPSIEYDEEPRLVRGKLRTVYVQSLDYVQCWIGDDQVDKDTVSED